VAVGCVLHILNLISMNAYHSTFGHELRTSFVASYLVHKFPVVIIISPHIQTKLFSATKCCAVCVGVESLLREGWSRRSSRAPLRALVVSHSWLR
jgi:hypothetical protein